MAATTLEPVIKDDTGSLPTFACTCAITQKPAPAKSDRALILRFDGFEVVETGVDGPVTGEVTRMGLPGIDHAFKLGV